MVPWAMSGKEVKEGGGSGGLAFCMAELAMLMERPHGASWELVEAQGSRGERGAWCLC